MNQQLFSHDIFQYLDEESKRFVLKYMPALTVTADTILVKQESAIDNLFIITEGEAHVIRALPGNHSTDVALISKGDLFGDLAFIDRGVASASVVTKTRLHYVTLSVTTCRFFQEHHPAIYASFIKGYTQHCYARLKRLFNLLDPLVKRVSQKDQVDYNLSTLPRVEFSSATSIQHLSGDCGIDHAIKIFEMELLAKKTRELLLESARVQCVDDAALLHMAQEDCCCQFALLKGALQLTRHVENISTQFDVVAPGAMFSFCYDKFQHHSMYDIFVRDSAVVLMWEDIPDSLLADLHVTCYLASRNLLSVIRWLRRGQNKLLRLHCEMNKPYINQGGGYV